VTEREENLLFRENKKKGEGGTYRKGTAERATWFVMFYRIICAFFI
jgi:hypothetical protein